MKTHMLVAQQYHLETESGTLRSTCLLRRYNGIHVSGFEASFLAAWRTRDYTVDFSPGKLSWTSGAPGERYRCRKSRGTGNIWCLKLCVSCIDALYTSKSKNKRQQGNEGFNILDSKDRREPGKSARGRGGLLCGIPPVIRTGKFACNTRFRILSYSTVARGATLAA